MVLIRIDITYNNDYRFSNGSILFSLRDFGLRVADKFDSYCGIAKSVGSGVLISTNDMVVPLGIDRSNDNVVYQGSAEFSAFYGTHLDMFLKVTTL